MTIGDAVQMLTRLFREGRGIAGDSVDLHAHGLVGETIRPENPRLEAEILIRAVTGIDRALLLAHDREELSQPEMLRLRTLGERRLAGEPIAYIIENRPWYDLELFVDRRVLVPRPETEGLVERALAWAAGRDVRRVVDVGTGSGAIAIALARALPSTAIEAIDLSREALGVARENARRYGVEDRITFIEGSLLEPLDGPVDLVVANLPYIGEEEYLTLMPDVRLFEPREALVGGGDGHELSARLMRAATAILAPDGALMLELGPPQAEHLLAVARSAFPEREIRLERDLAGLLRYLLILSP